MAVIAQDLSDADLYTKDFARFEKLSAENAALIDEKEVAEMRWLELAEMAEALEI